MNQLTKLQNLTPAEIYSKENVDSILSKITEEAKSTTHDISTTHGRKEIASLAYKIAQSKTFMDDCGKKLGEDAKKTLDTINAERKKIRDTLDTLKEEVRHPLTEWEKQEEARKERHRAKIIHIQNMSNQIAEQWQTLQPETMRNSLETIKAEFDWEDFKEEGELQVALGIEKVTNAIARRSEYDKQQEELVALRAEKEEREKLEAERFEKEREEARLLAEAEAKKKMEERVKLEEQEREQKRLAREKQLAAEKEAAIKFEQEQSARKLKEAEERAVKEKEAAVEKERQRAHNENIAKLAAEEKRQSNLKHRAKINNEILKAFSVQGIDEETGKKIIIGIVTGIIPHTKINY